MRQEVKVLLQLTLEADTSLNKTQIKEKLESYLNIIDISQKGLDTLMVDIIEIREENEIYGTEETI